MKKQLSTILAAALIAAPAFAADDNEARVNASREAAKALQTSLQAELQKAMQEGGPLNAIEVCNTAAGNIAKEVSRAQKLRIGRTSLKVRNVNNTPDTWERKVLELFELRKKNGENPANLEFYEVVKTGDKSEFRYMKAIAIPQDAPCLKCHGTEIDPKVQAKLKELYPNDQATGFKTGDLRGAFTVRQSM
jgi:hypothetical protein